MPHSRRSTGHPPVLSTQQHAEAEAAFLANRATAVLDKPADFPTDIRIPDSPATLWAAISSAPVNVDVIDYAPAELRDWVAPVVVVHIGR